MKSLKLLFVLVALSFLDIQAQMPSHLVSVSFFTAKYTKEKVWDVQRSPAFPVAKQDWVLSGLKSPLDASGATIDWSSGRYLMFVAEVSPSSSPNIILDDVVKKGSKYNIGLNLYESNGKLVKVISKTGRIFGVGDKGFMYENEGSYGTFFSIFPINASSVVTYKPNVAQVTKLSEFANTTTSYIKPEIEYFTNPIEAGYYTLSAKCSGKMLDVLDASPNDGATIQQWMLNGNQAQHWKIEPVAGAAGYYTLTSRTSGKLLDVLDASTLDGAKVQQWRLNGNQAQHWKIVAVPNEPGYYVLLSRTSGKALNVVGESKLDGAKIVQLTPNGHPSQAWKLELVSSKITTPEITPANLNVPFFNTKYSKDRVWDVQRSPAFPIAKQDWVLSGLKNPLDASGAPIDMNAGRYLMFVADGNASNAGLTILDDVVKRGTKYNVSLNLYENNGKLVRVISKAGKLYGVGDKGFMYENEGSFGTFFSVFAVNASTVIAYKPNVGQVTKLSEFSNTTISDVIDVVKPNIEPVTKITAGYYTLTAECSGKLLDVLDASPLDGAVIQQWKLNGNQAQHWKIDPIAGAPGYYTLTSRTSGKLLDVLDASKLDGAKIQQWKLNGNQAQHWKIEAIPGKPGYFVLISRTSGKALDVVGESKADGARIEQRQVNGHSSQVWKLDQVR